MIDLTTFSDKELIALEQKIKEEKEVRQNDIIYKCNVCFTEYQAKKLCTLLEKDFCNKGFYNLKALKMSHSPIWKIDDSLKMICDFIFANYEIKVDKNKQIRIIRNASLNDDKVFYNDMYRELVAVIDKWVTYITYKKEGNFKCI